MSFFSLAYLLLIVISFYAAENLFFLSISGWLSHIILLLWICTATKSIKNNPVSLILLTIWIGNVIFLYPDLLVLHSDLNDYGDFNVVKYSLILLQFWEFSLLHLILFISPRNELASPDFVKKFLFLNRGKIILSNSTVFLTASLSLLLYLNFFSPWEIFESRLTGYKGLFFKIPVSSPPIFNLFMALNTIFIFISITVLLKVYLLYYRGLGLRFNISRRAYFSVFAYILSFSVFMSAFASQVRSNILVIVASSGLAFLWLYMLVKGRSLLTLKRLLNIRFLSLLFIAALLFSFISEYQVSTRGSKSELLSKGIIQSDPNLYAFSEILINVPDGGDDYAKLSLLTTLLAPIPSFVGPFKKAFDVENLIIVKGTIYENFRKPLTNTSISLTFPGEFIYALGVIPGFLLSLMISILMAVLAVLLLRLLLARASPESMTRHLFIVIAVSITLIYLPRSFNQCMVFFSNFLYMYIFLYLTEIIQASLFLKIKSSDVSF